jgi:hypothetical protein
VVTLHAAPVLLPDVEATGSSRAPPSASASLPLMRHATAAVIERALSAVRCFHDRGRALPGSPSTSLAGLLPVIHFYGGKLAWVSRVQELELSVSTTAADPWLLALRIT